MIVEKCKRFIANTRSFLKYQLVSLNIFSRNSPFSPSMYLSQNILGWMLFNDEHTIYYYITIHPHFPPSSYYPGWLLLFYTSLHSPKRKALEVGAKLGQLASIIFDKMRDKLVDKFTHVLLLQIHYSIRFRLNFYQLFYQLCYLSSKL